MASEKEESKPASGAKDLLFQDFRHLSESFWKYEQTGETRVNWFIGITTAAIGGLVTLTTQQYGLKGQPLRFAVMGGLLALLVFGLITLARLATRNKNSDKCKRGLDAIRQSIRDHFDPDRALLGYYPIDLPEQVASRETWRARYGDEWQFRKFGGLSHSVAAINSLVVGGIVGAYVFRATKECAVPGACIDNLSEVVGWSFLAAIAAFAVQLVYVIARESKNKEELSKGRFTHAFGAVYRLENGLPQYLLVRPKNGGDEWLLPKGHIDPGEGHGEAALREVREEAGVSARLLGPAGTIEYEVPKKEHVKGKAYLMELLGEGDSKEKEIRRPTWFPFEGAKKAASHPETRHLLDAAEWKRLELAMAKEPAKPAAAGREFYTDERCWIAELHNRDSDAGCSIARARVQPGITTQLHALRDTIERYVVLEGEGRVEIEGGAPLVVAPLDVISIPAGASQRITNTGMTDLIFLCVCTPRFRREHYQSMEASG
jgi:mannose-6-phosphate isomerase-like protein (cupin superfamily)